MNQAQGLFVKRDLPEVVELEEVESKEAFIKGAATTKRRSGDEAKVVEVKPQTRLEKLRAELVELEKQEAELWEETGKKPKTVIESFTKLPTVDKKLEIMFEDNKAMFGSKSKFISYLIEKSFEDWKKEKGE